VVEQWATDQLESINALIASLIGIRQHLPQVNDSLYKQLLTQFHFTATSTAKLKNLLQNWQLINANLELNWREADAKNAKQVLAWLECQLEKTQFYL